MFLLPVVTIWAWAKIKEARRLVILSWTLAATMIIWAIESAARFTTKADFYGHEQHTFTAILTIWFRYAVHFSRFNEKGRIEK